MSFGVDFVHVIIDVHVVGDSALVSVFRDEILIEEADRLFPRRGDEADEIGVEVFEHLAPEIVGRAVAFIRDDEVLRTDLLWSDFAESIGIAAAMCRSSRELDL